MRWRTNLHLQTICGLLLQFETTQTEPCILQHLYWPLHILRLYLPHSLAHFILISLTIAII